MSNNKLYDKYVNGTWQNPYQTQAVFAMAPALNFYSGRSFAVTMPANLWFTNGGSTVSGISIDFADGAGYRSITAGQSVSLNYADTGTKAWVFRLSLTNGSYLYSHSDVYVLPEPWSGANTGGSAAAGTARTGGGIIVQGYSPNEYEPIPITAGTAFNGQYGQGYITVDYASPSYNLTKPLIVVEGFDPGTVLNPENPYGESNYSTFSFLLRNSTSNSLRGLLQNDNGTQQYDIIYVDWKNGVDYLERNALLLESVIEWVNNKKAADGCTAPNVVLGQSMGGVIARYALKDMENKGLGHQTQLYINWDGPQQGANVPVSYQHMVRHVNSFYLSTNVPWLLGLVNQQVALTVKNALNLADFPASQELLMNRIDQNHNLSTSMHSNWQATLNRMGYPTQCRNVAVSNGSECGSDQGFQPGAAIVSINGKTNTRFLGDVLTRGFFPLGGSTFPILALLLNRPQFLLGIIPGRNTLNLQIQCNAQPISAGQQVYLGKLTYTKTVLWLISVNTTITNQSYSSVSSVLPIDGTEGGMYDIGVNFASANSSGSINPWLLKYSISASNIPQFNFVPTTSTLDIGNGTTALSLANYTAKYVGGMPPAAPYNTPFANFITAFNQNVYTSTGVLDNNENHIQIAQRNGDWVAGELNGITNQQANCSDVCSNNAIAGTAQLCGSGTYSVAVTSSSTTVTWSIDQPSVATLSNTQGTQVTLTQTSTGNATLTANISNSCGAASLSLPITVGNNSPLNGTYSTNTSTKSMNTVNYVPTGSIYAQYQWPGISNITATASGSGTGFSSYSGNFSFYLSNGQSMTVNLNGTSSCGPVSASRTFIQSSYSSYSLAASPNPAKGNINVAVTKTDVVDTTGASAKAKMIAAASSVATTKILLYDFNTNALVKQWAYQEAKPATGYKLNIAGLKSGYYILKMERDNQTTSTTIFVQ